MDIAPDCATAIRNAICRWRLFGQEQQGGAAGRRFEGRKFVIPTRAGMTMESGGAPYVPGWI